MEDGTYHRGGGYHTQREAREGESESRKSPYHIPKMGFGELCDKYLTWIKNRGQSERWICEKTLFIKKYLTSWFGISAEDIHHSLIEGHLFGRAKRVSNFSANKDLKFLKAIFTFGLQMGYCFCNPCEKIRKLPTEERVKYIPSVADFLKVLAIAKPMEQKLLILLSRTAARIGEILDLKWSDVGQDYVILRSRKHTGGMLKERKIPLSPDAAEVIEWLRSLSGEQARSSEHLFTNNRTGTRFLRRPKLMRTLCRKAGVKPFGFHSLRHLGASLLSRGMVPLKDIGTYLGHAKITTTDRYIQSLEDSLSKAAGSLDEALKC